MKLRISDELQALATVFQADLTNHLAAVRGDSDTYGYAIMLGDQSAELADAIAVSNRREDLAKFDENYRDEAKFIPDEWQHWHHDAFPIFRERFQVLLRNFQQSSPEWKEERLLIDSLCELYLRAAEAVVNEGGFGNIYYRVIWIPDSGHSILSESARRLNSPEVRAAAQCIFDEDLGG